MQEFSSVTASSYDAESLAPLLTEKATDGWSVVSIVAAGTNVVAYLQREVDGGAPVAAPVVDEVTTTDDVAPEAVAPVADAPFIPAAVATVADTPAPIDEPSGWASAPEETATPVQETADTSIADLASQASDTEVVTAVPVAEAAAATDSAVPAGWYADPSGRFELRYWDGTAWTEHVSRAGQQFTDPPVA